MTSSSTGYGPWPHGVVSASTAFHNSNLSPNMVQHRIIPPRKTKNRIISITNLRMWQAIGGAVGRKTKRSLNLSSCLFKFQFL